MYNCEKILEKAVLEITVFFKLNSFKRIKIILIQKRTTSFKSLNIGKQNQKQASLYHLCQILKLIKSIQLAVRFSQYDYALLQNMLVMVRVGNQLQWSSTHYGTISAEFQNVFAFELSCQCYSILIYHNPQIKEQALEESSFEQRHLIQLGMIQAQHFPERLKHIKKSVFSKGNPKYCKSPLVQYEVDMTTKALKMLKEMIFKATSERSNKRLQDIKKKKDETREKEKEKEEIACVIQEQLPINQLVTPTNKIQKNQSLLSLDEENVVFRYGFRPVEIGQSALKSTLSVQVHSGDPNTHLRHFEHKQSKIMSKKINCQDRSQKRIVTCSNNTFNNVEEVFSMKSHVNGKKHILKLKKSMTKSRALFTTQSQFQDQISFLQNPVDAQPSQQSQLLSSTIVQAQTMRSSKTSNKLCNNINLQSIFSRSPRSYDQNQIFNPDRVRKVSIKLKAIQQVLQEEEDTNKHQEMYRSYEQASKVQPRQGIKIRQIYSSSKKNRGLQSFKSKREHQAIKRLQKLDDSFQKQPTDKNVQQGYLIFNTIIFQNFDKVSKPNPTHLIISHGETEVVTECICQKAILFTQQRIPLSKSGSQLVTISVKEFVQQKNILFGKALIKLSQLRKLQHSRTVKLGVIMCGVVVGELLINLEFSGSELSVGAMRKRNFSLQENVRKKGSLSPKRKSRGFKDVGAKKLALPQLHHIQ